MRMPSLWISNSNLAQTVCFIDKNLRAGQNFPEELKKQLAACTKMITLIGPKWLDVTNEAGARRLDDPQDWVRREIESALARKIVVIPVLTGGASSLPKAADLPETLKPLIERHFAVIRPDPDAFGHDVAGLIHDLREDIRGPRWRLIGVAAGVLALAGSEILSDSNQNDLTANPASPY